MAEFLSAARGRYSFPLTSGRQSTSVCHHLVYNRSRYPVLSSTSSALFNFSSRPEPLRTARPKPLSTRNRPRSVRSQGCMLETYSAMFVGRTKAKPPRRTFAMPARLESVNTMRLSSSLYIVTFDRCSVCLMFPLRRVPMFIVDRLRRSDTVCTGNGSPEVGRLMSIVACTRWKGRVKSTTA